jgi:hypothetical protein
MESHICGSSRMLVRCPLTFTLRITSELRLSGRASSFEARRALGKAETMGAIRGCDAAPDSQPWEAHYKPGIVNIRLYAEMFVILAESWRCFSASHTPILMDDFPPILTSAMRT